MLKSAPGRTTNSIHVGYSVSNTSRVVEGMLAQGTDLPPDVSFASQAFEEPATMAKSKLRCRNSNDGEC
jgi:hypothetical protein